MIGNPLQGVERVNIRRSAPAPILPSHLSTDHRSVTAPPFFTADGG